MTFPPVGSRDRPPLRTVCGSRRAVRKRELLQRRHQRNQTLTPETTADKIVATVFGPMGMSAAPRMAGFTTMMCAIVMNVVAPPINSKRALAQFEEPLPHERQSTQNALTPTRRANLPEAARSVDGSRHSSKTELRRMKL